MKKRILCALLAMCMICIGMSTLTASAASKNYFANGNFSSGMNSWYTWSNGTPTFQAQNRGGVDDSKCVLISNTEPVAASLYQFINLQKGKTYMVTAQVKYENVSLDGGGVVLGIAMYDSASNNIGETLSSSRYGTSDGYSTISMIFKYDTENAAAINVGVRLWFSTGKLYVDNLELREVNVESVPPSTFEMSMADTPNRFTVDALGVEWDPKLLLPCNIEKGVTQDDLTFMKERLDVLGIQAVRMMFMPEWIEPQNDNDDPHVADSSNFNFEGNDIKTTLAYLKVCDELGIKVTLTWWGAATGKGGWLSYQDSGDWISAPNDLDEMAENITYFLNYLKSQNINCVKQLILQNEPSYSFKVAGGVVDFNYYVEYYKTVYNRLQSEGLSDIGLVASDDAQSFGWFCQSYDALKDYCVAFNSHNYAWSYDTPYLDAIMDEFISARTQYGQEKPFFMGEFGDGSTQNAYYAASVETYGRGMYLASMAVNTLKAGAAGLSYWGLHDVYYYINNQGGDNGGLMETGLIGYKKDGAWTYRPSYYAWGMMCNYIPYGSEIYNITGDNGNILDVVGVKTPEGKWSVIAVNRSQAEQTLVLSAAQINSDLNIYAFEEGKLPTDGSMITPSALARNKDGVYTVTIPKNGFYVMSNIQELIEVEEETTVEEQITDGNVGDSTEDTDVVTNTQPDTDNMTTVTTPAEDATNAENVTQSEQTTTPVAEDGCASTVSGVALMSALTTAGLLTLRKKKED